MTEIRPLEITANRLTTELTIQWSDSHTSRYPFTLLRKACPCVECRGGHEKMGSMPDEELFNVEIENTPQTRMRNLEAVGAYALAFTWEDGHHYGIYKWSYLRALCPCPICRAEARFQV